MRVAAFLVTFVIFCTMTYLIFTHRLEQPFEAIAIFVLGGITYAIVTIMHKRLSSK